jgi:hypothetical protein
LQSDRTFSGSKRALSKMMMIGRQAGRQIDRWMIIDRDRSMNRQI